MGRQGEREIERESERCRFYLLVYCPWISLLLLLYCPSLPFFVFVLFCTARRALVYTRGSRLISISLLSFYYYLSIAAPLHRDTAREKICEWKPALNSTMVSRRDLQLLSWYVHKLACDSELFICHYRS